MKNAMKSFRANSTVVSNFKKLFLATFFGLFLMSFQTVEHQSGLTTVTVSESCPTADFSFDRNENTVTFTNQSGGAVSYFWDFGDGNTSTDANPQHVYQNPGSYEVSLTASNMTCASEFIGTVEIIGT